MRNEPLLKAGFRIRALSDMLVCWYSARKAEQEELIAIPIHKRPRLAERSQLGLQQQLPWFVVISSCSWLTGPLLHGVLCQWAVNNLLGYAHCLQVVWLLLWVQCHPHPLRWVELLFYFLLLMCCCRGCQKPDKSIAQCPKLKILKTMPRCCL